MGLESGTYLSDLVSSNPTGTDFESQGDDHLRLIKSTLQSTFPNADRVFRFFGSSATKEVDYNVSETADLHKFIPAGLDGSTITITLPTTAIDGWWCIVYKINSTADAVTIATAGSELINGSASISFTIQHQAALLWWNQFTASWTAFTWFYGDPYYSGGPNIPFSDIAPSSTAKRLLGAVTATDFSEQTIETALDWLAGSESTGDIIHHNGTDFVRFNPGTSGYFLKSNGLGQLLTWALPLVPAFSSTTYATNGSLAGTIPYDDSIPQVGEGTEILSTSITAIKASSKIKISFQGAGGVATAGPLTVALFIDGAASAVQATVMQTAAVNTEYTASFEYVYTPGDTSAHTISVRSGGTSGNHFWNGIGVATRRYGGAGAATLICQEIFTA